VHFLLHKECLKSFIQSVGWREQRLKKRFMFLEMLSDLGYQTSVTSSSPFLQSYMINVSKYKRFRVSKAYCLPPECHVSGGYFYYLPHNYNKHQHHWTIWWIFVKISMSVLHHRTQTSLHFFFNLFTILHQLDR